MPMTFILLAAGIILLYFGAELLVRGSSTLALRFGISALTVGLTVVAFGTSAPELVVSIGAGLDGQPDIAVGNIIGSNIFNIAIILGISAIIRPLSVNLQVLRIDTPVMIAVSVLFSLLLLDGTISRFDAVLLFSGIVAYTIFSLRSGERKTGTTATGENEKPATRMKESIPFNIFLIVTGLGMLIAGSRFFVGGAVNLATFFHVSGAVIGLTIVAAGTSLPELATSVVAATRKEVDIAIGNIVGSNIFNMLAIAGISGTITPLKVKGVGMVDLGFMLGTALCLLPFMRSGFRLNRVEGMVLLVIYGGYLWYLWPK